MSGSVLPPALYGFNPSDYLLLDEFPSPSSKRAENREKADRHPPILHLRWLWLIVYFFLYLGNAITTLQHLFNTIQIKTKHYQYHSHLQSNLIRNSQTITGSESLSNSILPISLSLDSIRLRLHVILSSLFGDFFLPSWIDNVVNFLLFSIITPLFYLYNSARQQFLIISLNPGQWLLGIISAIIYGGSQILLKFLQILTGNNRSLINVFDDDFDLQYCVADLNPSYNDSYNNNKINNINNNNSNKKDKNMNSIHNKIPRKVKAPNSTSTSSVISPAPAPIPNSSRVREWLHLKDRLYPYDYYPRVGIAPVVTPIDVILALIAKLGYEDGSVVAQVVQSHGWGFDEFNIETDDLCYDSLIAKIDQADLSVPFQSRAILLTSGNSCVVCFRGTYPTATVQWLTDLAAKQITWPGQQQVEQERKIKIHQGFFTALGLVVVGNSNYPETLFSQLLRLMFERKYERIYVTGHSLGAALATVFTFALLNDSTLAVSSNAAGERRLEKFDIHKHSWSHSTVRTLPSNDNLNGQGTDGVNSSSSPYTSTFLSLAFPAIFSDDEPARRKESPLSEVENWRSLLKGKLAGVYTYGSPRVGNAMFADKYDALFVNIPVHRFINKGDIVPRLPPPLDDGRNIIVKGNPSTEEGSSTTQEQEQQTLQSRSSAGLIGWLREISDPSSATATIPPVGEVFFNYAHVDGLRYLNDEEECPHVVNQDAPPTPWVKLNILDHFPGDYVRHVNSALAAQIKRINEIKLFNHLNKINNNKINRQSAESGSN